MKGIKHKFLRLAKEHGVKSIVIRDKWLCSFKDSRICVPKQDTILNLFFGLHELAHFVLHNGDKRNYDDLKSRIEIEVEADEWANKMLGYHFQERGVLNNYTMGLIALYLLDGGVYSDFVVSKDDRFVYLERLKFPGVEIFGQFISNLPMHPAIW